MDAFPLIVMGAIAAFVGLVLLAARFYPGSGADLLDWEPSRSYEQELDLEAQDVQQMIEAQNAYRRRRGETELTEEEVRESVVRDELRHLRDQD
jgi:hypothetical protein